jgi:hypothetical protein
VYAIPILAAVTAATLLLHRRRSTTMRWHVRHARDRRGRLASGVSRLRLPRRLTHLHRDAGVFDDDALPTTRAKIVHGDALRALTELHEAGLLDDDQLAAAMAQTTDGATTAFETTVSHPSMP